MSLPACQQRVLDRMEDALRASEPRLTSMYAMFARLNLGEPIGVERLTRKRRRWLQPGSAMYAIVLIPVMFAAVIVGALLGGGARSAVACEASYSVGGVSPLAGRPPCTIPADKGQAKMTVAKSAVRKTVSATARLACATAGQAARFTTLAGHESVPTPATRDSATVQSPPVMCYK